MEYTPRPDLYDLEYSFKDYAGECARIDEIVRARNPDAHSLLDVACGTGKHLELLLDRFEHVEGVDADEGMLVVARQRVPMVTCHHGDMRTFELGRRFDVVTCLFSSIGFVLDLDGLAAAARRLAAHLAPGGVLLVEPWITPEEWMPNRPHLLAAEREGVVLARVTISGMRGRISTTDMHYVLGTPEGVQRWEKHQQLGLFTDDEMRGALEAAGLDVEHDPEGLIGRGLYVARPSATSADAVASSAG
jgi:SAM-dependent methyltransferase